MQATGISVILGIIAAALVAAVGFGVNIPIIGNGRAAFFTLAILGMAMCSRAIKPDRYGWLNPVTITGCVLGVAVLALIGVVLFRIRLPLITTDRAATLTLGAAMGLKVVLDLIRGLLA